MKELSRRGLSASALKLIAITAMLIDHFAWLFVPLYTTTGQVLHVIGRMTIPIMCFFIAEGYFQTRNIKKYAGRLAVFALVAQVPYTYFRTGEFDFVGSSFQMNVIFTLLCSLLAVWVWDKKGQEPTGWVFLFVLFLIATAGDWSAFAVLFTLAFAANRGNITRQCFFFAIAATCAATWMAINTAMTNAPLWGGFFQFGLLLAIPPLLAYNGQRGGTPHMKWIFYLFYPVHLLVLAFLYHLLA